MLIRATGSQGGLIHEEKNVLCIRVHFPENEGSLIEMSEMGCLHKKKSFL